jgi:hypothetical protein
MKGIRFGVAVSAVAVASVFAISVASASGDTVQLSKSCTVDTTLMGGTCAVHQRCPDKVTTSAGVQPVLGCVASGEVFASGELTGLLRASVKAQPLYGGVSPGPRVKAGCKGNLSNCTARTDGQNIGNGGPSGDSDVERAHCNTHRSLGVLFLHTRCTVFVNAVTAP